MQVVSRIVQSAARADNLKSFSSIQWRGWCHSLSMAIDGLALLHGPARAPSPEVAAGGGAMSADASLRRAVEQHLELVWRVLRRSGLSRPDAEDVAQDVFWILAQRLSDVPERARKAFLVGTAVRAAADRRRSKWNRAVDAGLDLQEEPSTNRSLDEELDLHRAARLLDQALATLEETDRAIYVMAELEQMTRTEMAAALRLPKGTVASRLRRAREELEIAVSRIHRGARS
jgi:RNA polymerase sigma-70 factor, ECF subfamily